MMNTRFILILSLITLTILAWTFIHYQYEESKQFRLQQLSGLPVYVYMNDAVLMDSLSLSLPKTVPQIASVAKERGELAAQALVREYDLGIEPNTLDEYKFPHVMTLTFKPDLASFPAREKAIQLLKQKNIPASDIDNQDAAWNLTKKELEYLRNRWSNSTLFTAIIVFLMFVFARLFIFLAESRKSKGMRETILDTIRHKEIKIWHSALLLAVPVLINIILYYLLLSIDQIKSLVSWSFFLIQFCALLTASVVAILLDNMRDPDDSEESHGITVTMAE